MTAIDLEAEYNNRRRVPEHPAIQERWAAASARVRKEVDAELDVAYGTGERHRFDLYHSTEGGSGAPLAVYIHGGYWQRGDRTEYAFAAAELVARGVGVAIPSYSLCPAVAIADIVAEIQQFLGALWARTRQRPVIVGHSAGGHLAAAMLATDWRRIADVPGDLVRCGYAISGVFELGPLIPTSLNEALRLTPEAAGDASPLLWPPPGKTARFVAAVGGAESREFLRQSLEIAARWSAAGVAAECVVVPDANHFTVLDELARPGSAMVARIAELARSAAG